MATVVRPINNFYNYNFGAKMISNMNPISLDFLQDYRWVFIHENLTEDYAFTLTQTLSNIAALLPQRINCMWNQNVLKWIGITPIYKTCENDNI